MAGDPDRGFLAFWRRLADVDNLIRFFARDGGAYYTVHGENALFVADTFYSTRSVVRQLGSGAGHGVESVVCNRQLFARVAKTALTEKRWSVEVYQGSGGSWELDRRASPGNFAGFADTLRQEGFEADATFMAVLTKKGAGDHEVQLGVAIVDTAWRTFSVYEFEDHSELSVLETVVAQSSTREAIVQAGSPEVGSVVSVLTTRCGVDVSKKASALFEYVGSVSLLTRVFVDPDGEEKKDDRRSPAAGSKFAFDGFREDVSLHRLSDLDSKPLGCRAAIALVRHLDLDAQCEAEGRFKLQIRAVGQRMRLNAASLESLPLFRERQRGRFATDLFSLLDSGVSPMSHRLLRRWLLQPLCDSSQIAARHDVVQLFLQDSVLRQTVRDAHLRGLADIERIAHSFDRGRAKLRDLLKVYRFSVALNPLADSMKTSTRGASCKVDPAIADRVATTCTELFICPLEDCSTTFQKLQGLVEATLDLEDALERGRYHIKPSFNEQLAALHAESSAAYERAESELLQIRKDLKADPKKLKLDRHQVYGLCARMPSSQQKILHKSKTGKYTQLAIQATGVFFTTAKLRGISLQYLAAVASYNEAQDAIGTQVLDVAATFVPIMKKSAAIVAKLDILCGFASVAASAPTPYTRPQIEQWPSDTGGKSPENVVVQVKGMRHPCVERQDSVSYVASEVSLDSLGERVAIITGPNMGGKSTFIRSVASLALMNQIGSFVPAEVARLPVFDSLLMRVGASDNHLRGVSTFMAEMLEVSAILRSATSRSLVVIDEIGRGTSTFDGFGVAASVTEYLATESRCFSLIATHFHELTALADSLKEPDAAVAAGSIVKNLHVAAAVRDGAIVLTHEVKDGPGKQSFGIAVAQVAGMPAVVIEDAAAALDKLQTGKSLVAVRRTADETHDDPPGKRPRHSEAAGVPRS